MKNIFITGIGSGLGEALTKEYLDRGDNVYAVGRTFPKSFDRYTNFFFFPYDLNQTFMLKSDLQPFIEHRSFDIAILNAGILGEIDTLEKTNLLHMKDAMEVNVWANKEIIDALSSYSFVKQIVGISSGAAINGSKGWGTYSISKSALNMLLKVYSKELPEIHFTALAPGVIKTPMTEYVMQKVDDSLFPSVKALKENHIQTPKEAAKNLIFIMPKLLEYESGSFLDVRSM